MPTPSGVSAERPDSDAFFGRPGQISFSPEALVSLELFKGDTSFAPRAMGGPRDAGVQSSTTSTPANATSSMPRRRPARIAPPRRRRAAGGVRRAQAGRRRIALRLHLRPRRHPAVHRATSAGSCSAIPTSASGCSATGARNRNQWNVAYFDQLEKETNSELNLLSRRNQRVVVANYYRQDFLTPGYTISPSFHANLDRGDEPLLRRERVSRPPVADRRGAAAPRLGVLRGPRRRRPLGPAERDAPVLSGVRRRRLQRRRRAARPASTRSSPRPKSRSITTGGGSRAR